MILALTITQAWTIGVLDAFELRLGETLNPGRDLFESFGQEYEALHSDDFAVRA